MTYFLRSTSSKHAAGQTSAAISTDSVAYLLIAVAFKNHLRFSTGHESVSPAPSRPARSWRWGHGSHSWAAQYTCPSQPRSQTACLPAFWLRKAQVWDGNGLLTSSTWTTAPLHTYSTRQALSFPGVDLWLPRPLFQTLGILPSTPNETNPTSNLSVWKSE